MPNSRLPFQSHLGVWKTLTSGIESAGEVAGDVGTTEGDLDTTAGVFGSMKVHRFVPSHRAGGVEMM